MPHCPNSRSQVACRSQGCCQTKISKGSAVLSSIHNYNQWLTPSPSVPFPQENSSTVDGKAKVGNTVEKEYSPMPPPEDQKEKSKKPLVFTVVLHQTPESLQMDLFIKASTPQGTNDMSGQPPSTPMSLIPPTPTTANMPPPAKRQKREKTELDGSNIYEAEGQILLATNAPLVLSPTRTIEENIILLEAMSHPKHSQPPPQPKTRKRTRAEMAADEAQAAGTERFMLIADPRAASSANGAQNGGTADVDASTGASTFEPRFERFKVIDEIIAKHNERKEQEKAKQQEADRKLQQQRAQVQQEAAQSAQKMAQEDRNRNEAAAAREKSMRQAEQQRQAQAQAQAQAQQARVQAAAQANQANQNAQRLNVNQQHAHPQNNAITNGANSASAGTPQLANNMPPQAQPRFQAQISQPPASSPVARQGTPQHMSSPMVGSVPMQQTNSGMANSPPRPSSVVQNPAAMSVPMAHAMSSRGSQQSHPSGTPRMPHSTPSMNQGTPINRPTMIGTPRMTQVSPHQL
ncbi:hypothetical protein NXS19_001946 [Fusarium pseudograminearum]|nr:hypothetical protein NXS19_001946 [Fusarium pseudograminearum]